MLCVYICMLSLLNSFIIDLDAGWPGITSLGCGCLNGFQFFTQFLYRLLYLGIYFVNFVFRKTKKSNKSQEEPMKSIACPHKVSSII